MIKKHASELRSLSPSNISEDYEKIILSTNYLTVANCQSVRSSIVGCRCAKPLHLQNVNRKHTAKNIAIVGHFGEVQPGFLQLLLTQTCVKCTSLDSSRCVVHSGIRFEAIWAASKKLEQDGWWKPLVSSGHLVLLFIYYYFLYKFIYYFYFFV